MSIDALRDTLVAQGIDQTKPPRETIGHVSDDPTVADVPLPEQEPEQEPEAEPQQEEELTVIRELGRGGMGVVQLATQHSLRREVAIKRLIEDDPADADALLREARLTGGLEHPNIVPVHAVINDEQGPAVVMKRISGVEWHTRLQNGIDLDLQLDVFVQVCRAVAFAHSRDVVHRDIKPSNVMIGEFGEVYLVDWGLARHLVDGVFVSHRLMGTPGYMAPEMIEGRTEKRSDVYLLGATLHEVLTGSLRHTGKDLVAVLTAAAHSEPHTYPSSVPAALAEICNRACAADLEDRYASVDELITAVRLYRERRVAESLAAIAESRTKLLESVIEKGAEYAEVQRIFNEARFAFEQALEGWPAFARAKSGRTRCLRLMIDHELELEHPENAAALLATMPEPPEEALARVRELRASRDEGKRRFEELERDRDPTEGAEERMRATYVLAAGVTVLIATFVSLRFVAPHVVSGPLRLLLVGGVVLMVGIGVARHWATRAPMNLINRRIVQVVIGTLVVSLINRALGWLGGADLHTVLETDALLLVGGGLALSPFHVAGRWVAGLLLAVAIVGALEPAWLEPMFIGSAALISCGIVVRLRATSARSRR